MLWELPVPCTNISGSEVKPGSLGPSGKRGSYGGLERKGSGEKRRHGVVAQTYPWMSRLRRFQVR